MRLSSITVLAFVASLLASHRAFATEPDCRAQTLIDVDKIHASVVLIGEVHGTQEIPRFTSGLICSLLKAGRPVILGIEHSSEQQAALNRYVVSNGDDEARAALLQGVNWRSYSDGRGSQAMFELVDVVRRLRGQGQPVAIVAIDRNEGLDVPSTGGTMPRVSAAENATLNRLGNEAMAHSVLYAALVYRPYVVVVLSGFSHTSTLEAVTDDPMLMTYRPMGQVIATDVPVFTIGIETGGGKYSATGESGSKVYALQLGSLYVRGVHVDATAQIDRLTASMPARDMKK